MSVAVRLEMATARVVAVVGMLKVAMVGAVVSGSVMLTAALRLLDTLPAASLDQA